MRKFEVIEDNGGGLILAIFNEKNEVEYIHSGYEYNVGQLKNDLEELENGSNPATEWDGNCGGSDWEFGNDPQALYDNITSFENGWEIVADNNGTYPNKMGNAARLEFGVED